MGWAKLNVWIRNEKCQVVHRDAHLHVDGCCQEQGFGTHVVDGHAEMEVPPGCYILAAGVYVPDRSNIYTDKTMVIVGCEETACVNLVLKEFNDEEAKHTRATEAQRPLVGRTCPPSILVPLAVNAPNANVDPAELQTAIKVIVQAANIDTEQINIDLNSEEKLIQAYFDTNRERLTKQEQDEVQKHIKALQQLVGLIG